MNNLLFYYSFKFIVRLKFQKQSVLKFVSRTIPRSGGSNTPQLAAEPVSKACFVGPVIFAAKKSLPFDNGIAFE